MTRPGAAAGAPPPGRVASAGTLALLAAAVCGSILPVQSRVNGRLSEQVGPSPAAVVSFATGLALLTVLLLAHPPVRRRLGRVGEGVRSGRLHLWQLVGGVGGGLLVAAQTYAVPLVGVTAFLIAVIGGQSVSALLVDRAGLAPGPPQRLTGPRVAAAALAVVGVAVAATAPGRADTGGQGAVLLLVLVLVLLAGAGTSVQQALNGVVTTVTRDGFATAWLNFATGTATLVLLGLVSWLVAGAPPMTRTLTGLPWWAVTGGAMGVVFIALAAWAVQHLPVLVFALVTVTTQLLVGVLLDLLDPAARQSLGPQVLAGVAIALAAAIWAALARGRGGAPRHPSKRPGR